MTVLLLRELEEALNNAPKWWGKHCQNEVINQAVFLVPSITIEKVYKAVEEFKPDYK